MVAAAPLDTLNRFGIQSELWLLSPQSGVPLCPFPRYGLIMTVDPRAALDRLIAALEAHYTAIVARSGEDDPGVDDAYDVLADAFEVYDDALGTVHGEATPFYLGEDDDADGDDDVDEDDLDDDLDDDDLDLADDDVDEDDDEEDDEDEDDDEEDDED